MAYDYNEITEAQTNPGAPGTSSLWKRWWKNPIAMMRGEPGAPGLWNRGLVRPTVGAVSRVAATGGGGNFIIGNANPPSSSLIGTVQVLGFGAMRLFTDGRGGGALEWRRTRAGVVTVLASLNMTGTTQAFSVDVTFQPLDVFSLFGRSTASTSGTTTITTQCFNAWTAGEDLWLCGIDGPAAFFPILNNTAP